MKLPEGHNFGGTAKIVSYFLTGNFSVLFIVISVLVGAVALLVTPREEEPQITVPMADVFLSMPGSSPQEVEALAAGKLEKLLMEIDGVENVFLAAQPGGAMVTVQFYVGQDRERSLVKLYNKIQSNVDRIPPAVHGWVVKPVEIDDVPILTVTFYTSGNRYTDYDLRRIAEEIEYHVQQIPEVGKTFIVGGRSRQITLRLDKERLSAYRLVPGDLVQALQGANLLLPAGTLDADNATAILEAGDFLRNGDEVRRLVVSVHDGRPVYLGDVAQVTDGPSEVASYTWNGFGAAFSQHEVTATAAPGEVVKGRLYPAVTLAIAKKKGSNAVAAAEQIIRRGQEMRGRMIPDGVNFVISRNYGETANEKVNELVKHLFIAVLTILVLLIASLGFREAVIVALAVPMTLAFTLISDTLIGFTINRVTLFALILSLGLLVDDPIVDVENIFRHFKMRKYPPRLAALIAVDEIRPPTILATFAVIVSFLPLFLVTGMMGPYMAPMPFNISVAMIMSLVVAFTVTPWAAYHLLKHEYHHTDHKPEDPEAGLIGKGYRGTMSFLMTPAKSWVFLGFIVALLLGSVALPVLNLVPLKMLPFDNKNELQLVVDMDEGTSLEQTDAVARDLSAFLARQNEVVNFQIYSGTASPFDFNGLVRHYYMRRGANMADIRINLLPRHERKESSHDLALRIRSDVEGIGKKYGANIKIVESPPGPPVLATGVAEISADSWVPLETLHEATRRVEEIFRQTPGFADVDDMIDADQKRVRFTVDREKAMLHGIPEAQIAQMISLATGGDVGGHFRLDRERNPLPIVLQLPLKERSSIADVLAMDVRAQDGSLVNLGELVEAKEGLEAKAIYHKNGVRTQFVTAEVVGTSPYIPIMAAQSKVEEIGLPAGTRVNWRGEGEWKITIDVFRDMGIAFAAALAGIYILLLVQTGSMAMPLIIMAAIPLTMIGIMPGFAILNLLFSETVGGYESPIFFTATGMIGMIALAGIVVRNSIILIDFIQTGLKSGAPLTEAIITAGQVRFRPILLTAGAAMLGSWVIALDPIFSGLAWSFIFGIFASTAFTLVVVPVIFYLVHRNKPVVDEKAEEDFWLEA